jgi:hypothetical protein
MTECKNHNVPDFDEKYESARTLFNETAKLFADEGRENIPDVRENLRGCVASLRSMYLMYPDKVDNIDGLPMPTDIKFFDYNRLESLVVDLRERYFPTQEVFEAA